MKSRSLIYAFGILMAVAALTSCSKEGPQGPEGPAGPAGPQGPQGNPGVANVIYSEWLDVVYEPGINEQTGDTVIYVGNIAAPKLTNEILSQGEVKVYVNIGTAETPLIFPLPLFDAYELTGIFNLTVFFSEGQIDLFSTNDASTGEDDEGKFFQYRYVLIPGGALAAKPNNVNLNNYAEAKKYLQLKD